MDQEREDMYDFITGYGSLGRAEEDFKRVKRTYRIFTVIEIIACLLAIKFFVF